VTLVPWLLVVAGAYLLGSVPFSFLAARLRTGQDIRTAGSGNVGTTNVLRVAGKAPALAALLGDVGKGVAAVLLAQRLTGVPAAGGAAGVAAVLGHVRPLFLRRGGGKGGATGFAALVALAPAAGAMCVVVLVAVIMATRYVSAGTIATAAASPLLVVLAQRLGWVHDGGAWLPLAVAGIAVIILVRHRANLERLRAGVEPRLGGVRTQPDVSHGVGGINGGRTG
jgi:acyl phosphate:glycerol-3-phosphate acyltransferase